MPETSRRTLLPLQTADAVWHWHMHPTTLERLTPPWQRVELERFPTPFTPGSEAVLRVHAVGRRWTWTSRLDEVEAPRGFTDVTTGAPLARWVHQHRFVAVPDGVRLEDHVDWALSAWARLAAKRFERDVSRLLAWRHRVTAEDLGRLQRWRDASRLRVGVTGASGLVGTALSRFLRSAGHTVVPLVRRPPRQGEIRWYPAEGRLYPDDLVGLDAIVHLAGESIAPEPWTPERKSRIRDSRVLGTEGIARAMARCQGGPRILVSASAVGFWGNAPDPVDESCGPGVGFLAEVGQAWEAAADPARDAGIRVVHPRLGLVLSGRGGLLGSLLTPYLLGAGGPIGSGRQHMPWIALDDVVGVLHEALHDPRYEGPIATVAPSPATSREFASTLGHVLSRPALLRVPASAARLAFGELADEVLLAGQQVVPTRLRELDFTWTRPDLEDTLRWELGRFDPHEVLP